MKLSQEEQENLVDMMSHDGMKALLRLMGQLVQSENDRVLKYSLDTQPEAGLIRLKLRTEGAAKLLSDLETKLKALRAKQ